MTIKLVTDSTCDLPAAWVEACGIEVVPINIQFGLDTYQENVDLSPAEFYNRIATGSVFPQTSQPSVGQFEAVYRRLATEADQILSLHVTAKLSGTHQSAVLAAREVETVVEVKVLDSMAGSAGLGWLLRHAHTLIQQGQSLADIVPVLEEKRHQISIFFAVDNLQFAQLSGRVNKLQGVIASVLNIKPVIGLDQGLIEVVDRTRSNRAALQRIVALTKKQQGTNPLYVGIVQAQAPERATELLNLAKQNLNIQQVFVENVAISLAVHFGPGTVGLVTYPAYE